jgi:mono/diheme cytochrome c family protein
MKQLLWIALLALSSAAVAATPRQLQDGYTAEAAKQTAGFQPSAKRGAEFYARRFAVSDKMPACATCHTDNPAQPGRHAITGKDIKPLRPAANPERLTDTAKVEKWFKRNCTEVLGRECNAGEKADFFAFLTEGR